MRSARKVPLVATKDGALVARHENEISETTDVEEREEFADRETTKSIDGRSVTGRFTEDFTLAELKTLRVDERLPELRQENTIHDGLYEIPTFDEVLALARNNGTGRARPIGVYPETKHSTYFDSIGLSLEEPLVQALRSHGLADRNAAMFVQSFETNNLRELDAMVEVRLVQLIGGGSDGPADGSGLTYEHMSTAAGLRTIASYADGVGPDKNRVIPVGRQPRRADRLRARTTPPTYRSSTTRCSWGCPTVRSASRHVFTVSACPVRPRSSRS